MGNKPWWLLYRKENGQRIWIYEQLWGKELKRRLREGWEIWRGG